VFLGNRCVGDARAHRLQLIDCVKLFTEHVDFLSAADKEWIVGRGLAECLNWPAKA